MTAEAFLDKIFWVGPYLVFAGLPVLLSLGSIKKDRKLHSRFNLHAIFSSLLISFFVAFLSIESGGSTSAIRILFIPLDFLIVYFLSHLNGRMIASCLALNEARRLPAARRILQFFLAALLSIQIPVAFEIILSPVQAFYLNKTRKASDLERFYSFLWNRHDRFVVSAIAKNEFLTQDLALLIVGNGNGVFFGQHFTLMDLLNGWNDHRPAFYWLAGNPRTPETVLRRLVDYPSSQILFALARNSNTPQDVLDGISEDGRNIVRLQLLYNEKLPEKILIKLADDPSITVREALAGREQLPASVAGILSEDSSSMVREKIESNLSAYEKPRKKGHALPDSTATGNRREFQ